MSPEPAPWYEKTTVRGGKEESSTGLNQKADVIQPQRYQNRKAGDAGGCVLPCSDVQSAQEVWPPGRAGKGGLALSAPST